MTAASTVTATGRRAASRASASAMPSTSRDPNGHLVAQGFEAAHDHEVTLRHAGAYLYAIVVTEPQFDHLLRHVLLPQYKYNRPAATVGNCGTRYNRHVL